MGCFIQIRPRAIASRQTKDQASVILLAEVLVAAFAALTNGLPGVGYLAAVATGGLGGQVRGGLFCLCGRLLKLGPLGPDRLFRLGFTKVGTLREKPGEVAVQCCQRQ